MKLNAGCGTHYVKGWINSDVWETETTKPDVKVISGQPYPFEDNTFDAIYLGHVIEHIEWSDLKRFMKDMSRIAKPDAPILIVGPDVIKTIQRWSEGKEPWHMVLSTMEHQEHNWQPDREHEFWDGATHHWNCHHERVWDLLQRLGFSDLEDYYEKIPNSTSSKLWKDEKTDIEWPVVHKWFWQFAIHFKNRKI